MSLYKIIVLLIVVNISWLRVYSQEPEELSTADSKILKIIEKDLSTCIQIDSTNNLLPSLLAKPKLRYTQFQESYYQKKINSNFPLKSLDFISGYNYRTKYFYLYNDEDYTAREGTYFGLKWNLLKNGYLDNRFQLKQYALEQKKRAINSNEILRNDFSYNYNAIMCYFTRLKLLKQKKLLNFIDQASRILQEQYFRGNIGYSELINLKKLKTQTQNKIGMLQDYLNYHNGDQNFLPIDNSYTTQIFDINITKIDSMLRDHYEQTKNIEKQILDTKYSKLNSVSLNLYAREHLNLDANNLQPGVSARFSLNIPLETVFGDKDIKLEKQKVVLNNEQEYIDKRNNINNLIYDYKDRLENYIHSFYKKQDLLYRLKRNKIKAKFTDLPLSSDLFINLYVDIHQVDFDILETKQRLFLKALDIFTRAGIDNISEYIKNYDLQELNVRSGKRGVYIWSNSFGEYDNDIIFDFLDIKSIGNISLSYSKNNDMQKFENFIKNANHNVWLLISSHSWLEKENYSKVKKELQRIEKYPNIQGIDIDIEPHQRDDWRANDYHELRNYIELLRLIRQNFDKKINITLPYFYPRIYLEEIAQYCDRISVMIYGKTNFDFIQRKLQNFDFLAPQKVSIALRMSDFINELELETLIEKIIKDTDYSKFYLQDLNSLFELAGAQ